MSIGMLLLYVYVYIYTHIYAIYNSKGAPPKSSAPHKQLGDHYIYIYTYAYIYIERERERGRCTSCTYIHIDNIYIYRDVDIFTHPAHMWTYIHICEYTVTN